MRRLVVAALSMAMLLVTAAPASAARTNQVSGIAYPPGAGECTAIAAEYAILLTGDLVGCIYGTVVSYRLHPGGTYQEVADEVFVGSWNGLTGTFELEEFFTAKWDRKTGEQQFGRCQHPIVTDSGTGDFSGGISGRLDFKDDLDAGNFPYQGHIRIAG